MAVMTTTFEQARFGLCEFGTDPFTCGELAALTRYEKAVEGIPDCFGCHTPDMFADGMSQCEAAGIFRAWSGLLNNWREATRTLQEDLTDGQPLRPLAVAIWNTNWPGGSRRKRNTAPWSSNTRSAATSPTTRSRPLPRSTRPIGNRRTATGDKERVARALL